MMFRLKGISVILLLLFLITTSFLLADREMVFDKESFLEALKTATAEDTIYIQKGIEIDFSGEGNIKIPTGVTIIGTGDDRESFSDYPLFFTDQVPANERINPLFVIEGDEVTISGIRIRGSAGIDELNDRQSIPGAVAIRNKGFSSLIITNCEIYNWQFAGILFDYGSTKNRVENCFIHHNNKEGYGYGVCIGERSFATIMGNNFDFNRHDIAGSGCQHSGYIARNNVIGKNGSSHSFDMHGGTDRKDGTNIAGSTIIIENNRFFNENHWAIAIRGIPLERAVIKDNEFYGMKNRFRAASIKQLNAFGNIYAGPNYYEYDYRQIEANGLLVKYAGSDEIEWLIQTNYDVKNVKMGDLNGDEVSDLFVVDSNGKWFVSWGALTSWQLHNETSIKGDIYVGDFYDDGKDDILLIDENRWYISNNGDEELRMIDTVNIKPEVVYVADFDGDGKSDVLCYYNHRWAIITDSFTKQQTPEMPFDGYRKLDVGDIKGDGKAEIIWEESGDILSGNLGSKERQFLLHSSIENITIYDFLNNGKESLFIADGERWRVKSFDEDDEIIIRESAIRVDRLLFGDINGDGKIDIIFSNKE